MRITLHIEVSGDENTLLYDVSRRTNHIVKKGTVQTQN